MKRLMGVGRWVFCVLCAWCVEGHGQALGSGFSYQAYLKDGGVPAQGVYDVRVCVYAGAADLFPLACMPEFSDVAVNEGLLSLVLDFPSVPFVGQERYLEFEVKPGTFSGDFVLLQPRQMIRAVPEAMRAGVSSAAPWSGLTGVPAGFADNVDNDAGGTVTRVEAGFGLSGGVITGSGTLAVDEAQVQRRVQGSCGGGQAISAIAADGSVSCVAGGGGSDLTPRGAWSSGTGYAQNDLGKL